MLCFLDTSQNPMVHLRLGLAHNGGIVSSSHLRLPMHISCRKQFRGFVRCRVSDDTGEDKANAASSDQGNESYSFSALRKKWFRSDMCTSVYV